MARFRMNSSRRPIDSKKHIVELSGILAAGTNTVVLNLIDGLDTYTLATANGVPTGAKVSSFYLSAFFYGEGGEIANEVPLVDWYVIKNPGNAWGITFTATTLPTPGATGVHKNKRYIIHTEKALTGGGDVSLSGVPMAFKGVIRIPRGMQRTGEDDRLLFCARANFATKFYIQAIYKHYS